PFLRRLSTFFSHLLVHFLLGNLQELLESVLESTERCLSRWFWLLPLGHAASLVVMPHSSQNRPKAQEKTEPTCLTREAGGDEKSPRPIGSGAGSRKLPRRSPPFEENVQPKAVGDHDNSLSQDKTFED